MREGRSLSYFAAFCKVVKSGGDDDMEGTSRGLRRSSQVNMTRERLSFLARRNHRLSFASSKTSSSGQRTKTHRTSVVSRNVPDTKPGHTSKKRGSGRVSFLGSRGIDDLLEISASFEHDKEELHPPMNALLSGIQSGQDPEHEMTNGQNFLQDEDNAANHQEPSNISEDEEEIAKESNPEEIHTNAHDIVDNDGDLKASPANPLEELL